MRAAATVLTSALALASSVASADVLFDLEAGLAGPSSAALATTPRGSRLAEAGIVAPGRRIGRTPRERAEIALVAITGLTIATAVTAAAAAVGLVSRRRSSAPRRST